MKNPISIEMHLDFTRARILLSRIQSVDDLKAIWKITGPCMEKYPTIERIHKRKNIS